MPSESAVVCRNCDQPLYMSHTVWRHKDTGSHICQARELHYAEPKETTLCPSK